MNEPSSDDIDLYHPVFMTEKGFTGWEITARKAYAIRFLLKERGWTYSEIYGRERDIWFINDLSPAGLERERAWILSKGWWINDKLMKESQK